VDRGGEVGRFGGGEHVGEAAQVIEALREAAGARPGERIVRVFMTRCLLRQDPTLRPALDHRLDAAPGVRRVGEAGGEQTAAEGEAAGGPPDLLDRGDPGATALLFSALGDARAAEDRGGDGEGGARDPPRSPRSLRAPIDHVEQVVHRRPAPLRIRGEAALEGPPQPVRRGRASRRRGDGPRAHRAGELDIGLAGEGPGAEEGLPEGDAEGEDVGARVGGRAVVLLWRHVGWGADDRASVGELRRERAALEARIIDVGGDGSIVGDVREAEVGDDDAAVFADEHVVWLKVAVDEAGAVGSGEAAAGGYEDREQLAPRTWRLGDPLAEGDAVDHLHGQEDLAVGDADVVHGDDVGVGELRHGLGFAEEALGGRAVDVSADELEGDPAIELGIEGGVDDSHAARAEALEHEVAVERGAASEQARCSCGRDAGSEGVAHREGRGAAGGEGGADRELRRRGVGRFKGDGGSISGRSAGERARVAIRRGGHGIEGNSRPSRPSQGVFTRSALSGSARMRARSAPTSRSGHPMMTKARGSRGISTIPVRRIFPYPDPLLFAAPLS
jgi:hypothetical protein